MPYKNKLKVPQYNFDKEDEQIFICICKFNGMEEITKSNSKKHAKIMVAKEIYNLLDLK